ncbi:diphthine synthase, putative [Entamoeba invadens IP1]|uniref:diphthine methyl ester synthase n=2 Tax=Entamoeba invadens TaxID=33085 RepID=A0A0A1UG00_ENTIV|nr:diphthine synthase, putative [Entamoeba invadens IP1]XP_004258855.1 diphthine synthase, putative [Entamoeba invadens IP1]ELP92068.1 diphthine synthase, putative [Entamoeba invadens IP1]ELP92084.1 diphthine synthase, putative [Entamoeba invadens IP1]BAN41585.1 diphthine synthase, putative [Entamoeba invadens]|eukprot:XP_004258839.1 diphthine synthase, putative [Entamoeba invadens IP1]
MLYIIGLGLYDEKDITVRGLEAIKSCDKIFLEHYTAILQCDVTRLEEFYGKKVIVADRDLVESEADVILEPAKTEKVALLVVGDVFGATTHSDIFCRCKKSGIEVKVIHNASIMNAVGCSGLQLYRFGQTVSVCFWTDNWKPFSYYQRIKTNRDNNMHTLVLLDIKVKERSEENIIKGRDIFEPPRYMTINQCIDQLLQVENSQKSGVYNEDTYVVGLARVAAPDQKIVFGKMKDLLTYDFGAPLHCLLIPSPQIDDPELDHLNFYKFK